MHKTAHSSAVKRNNCLLYSALIESFMSYGFSTHLTCRVRLNHRWQIDEFIDALKLDV